MTEWIVTSVGRIHIVILYIHTKSNKVSFNYGTQNYICIDVLVYLYYICIIDVMHTLYIINVINEGKQQNLATIYHNNKTRLLFPILQAKYKLFDFAFNNSIENRTHNLELC